MKKRIFTLVLSFTVMFSTNFLETWAWESTLAQTSETQVTKVPQVQEEEAETEVSQVQEEAETEVSQVQEEEAETEVSQVQEEAETDISQVQEKLEWIEDSKVSDVSEIQNQKVETIITNEEGKKEQKVETSGFSPDFAKDSVWESTNNIERFGDRDTTCDGFLTKSGSLKLHIETLDVNGSSSKETYNITISGIHPNQDNDGDVSVEYDVKAKKDEMLSSSGTGVTLLGIEEYKENNGKEVGTVQGWSNNTYAYCYKNNRATIGYYHTGTNVCDNCMITSDGSHRYKTYKYGVFVLELIIHQPKYTYLTTGTVLSTGGRRLNFKEYPKSMEGWAGTSKTSLNSNGVPTTSGKKKIFLQVHASNLGKGFWDEEANIDTLTGEITLQIVPVTATVGHSSLLSNTTNTSAALETNVNNQNPGLYFSSSYSAVNNVIYPIQSTIKIGKNSAGNFYPYYNFSGYTPLGWSAYNGNGQQFYTSIFPGNTDFTLLSQWQYNSWNSRFIQKDPGPDKGNVGSIVFYNRYRYNLFTNQYYLQLYSNDLSAKMGISNPYSYGNQTIKSWHTQTGAWKKMYVQFLDTDGRQISNAQQEVRLPFLGWYLSGGNKHLTIPSQTVYETKLLTASDVASLSVADGSVNKLYAQWGAVNVTPNTAITDTTYYTRHTGNWQFAYYYIPAGLQSNGSTIQWSTAISTRRAEFPDGLTNGTASTFGTTYQSGIPNTLGSQKHLSSIENNTNVYYKPVMEEIPLQLVYEGNGGTTSSGKTSLIDTETWKKSDTQQVTLDSNTFRKTGYYFAGWRFLDGSEKEAGTKVSIAFLNNNSQIDTQTKKRKVYATAVWKPISFTMEYHGQQYQKMEEQWAALLSLADGTTDFFLSENRKVLGATHIRNNTPYETIMVNGTEKKLGVVKGDSVETPAGWTKLSKDTSNRLSGQYKKNGVWVRGMEDSVHTYQDGSKLSTNDYEHRVNLSCHWNYKETGDLRSSEYWNLPFYRWLCYWNDGNGTISSASFFTNQKEVSAFGITRNHSATRINAVFSAKKITLNMNYQRNGYDFLGLSENPNAAVAEYTKDNPDTTKKENVIYLTKDTDLYAVWKAKEYPIIYHGNGGSWGSGEVTRNAVKVWDQSHVFYQQENLTHLQWQQTRFLGWSTDPDAREPEYLPGETLEDTVLSHYGSDYELHLYAVWLPAIRISYLNNLESMERDPNTTYEIYGKNVTDMGEENKDVLLVNEYLMYENLAEENQLPVDISDPRNSGNPIASPSNYGKNFAMEGIYQYLDCNGKEQEETVTATVVAWSFDPQANTESPDLYKTGEELQQANILYEKAMELGGDALTQGHPRQEYFQIRSNMEEPEEITDGENSLYVNLFAVYDYGPKIHGDNLFYSLKSAQEGVISFEDVISFAEVYDTEDSIILCVEELPEPADRQEDTTYYTLLDYRAEDFTSLTGDARISITYLALDSAGNLTKETIMVFVLDVDASVQDAKPRKGRTRFISYEYLWTLDENSIWRTEPYFSKLVSGMYEKEVDSEIKTAYPDIYNSRTESLVYQKIGADLTPPVPVYGDLFQKEVSGSDRYHRPPKQVWIFKKEDVDRVREYVEATGFTTYGEKSQLDTFLQRFDSCYYYENGHFRQTGTQQEPDFYRRWFTEEVENN